MIKKNYSYTSPNFGPRPEGMLIDTIVIHYTEMKDDVSALQRLCDAEAQVSSHYLINKKGEVFSLVPDALRAWHAGPSCWRGREKVNDFSIGIELDNNGKEEFSTPLMESLIELCYELVKEHPIKQQNIIGHSDVIPSRKFDPGRLFDWKLLAENNIGIYPNVNGKSIIPDIEIIQKMLANYGYKIEITGIMDQLTIDVMRAFNEHFNPKCFENWSEESQAILNALMK
jgi:N-acetylmuramoyl-L-alanine amidase